MCRLPASFLLNIQSRVKQEDSKLRYTIQFSILMLCANTVLNLRHVHFLFYGTWNIVDIGKFAHKIISVTFFSGTTQASFLIFGTKQQYAELYRVTQF